MSSEDEINQAVLAAIKEALKHPRQLSREEVIEFISRPIYMGYPMPLLAKSRGRKPKRTQYDLAYELRKGLYQRLVRLPQNRLGKTGGGYVPMDKILEIARKVPMKCKRVGKIKEQLQLNKLACPDDSTIRKILRKHGL